ncbi:MAG: hypothetical protein ABSH29_24570 [Acidimicrobiales bacterium]|jgi:hypothetical protein
MGNEEQQALDFFLSDYSEGQGPHSPLRSAIRDAQAASRGGALWLATLGYLVTAEILGRTIERPDTQFPHRDRDWQVFKAGFLEFANSPAVVAREPLWKLRCCLAHHYELRKIDRERDGEIREITTFTLARAGPLWSAPQPPHFTDWVNIDAVGHYVTELVDSAQGAHQAGEVRLRRNPQDVLLGGFVIE